MTRMEAKGTKIGQVYQDFSRLTEDDEACVFPLLSMDGSLALATVGDNFPRKLYGLLAELDKSGLAHVASWAPHGRCFKVHKPKEFVDLFVCRCVE
jgi:hypothetical protein